MSAYRWGCSPTPRRTSAASCGRAFNAEAVLSEEGIVALRQKVGTTLVNVVPTSLLTDRYELSMLDGALTSGLIDARATFEVFTRSLPNGYRYGVLAGTGRLLDELASFRFDESNVEWLLEKRIVSAALAEYLAAYRFEGDIVGYLEGEVFTSLSPVLRVEGRFADIVLETLALSILNFDSGVATKAMRVVRASEGRRLIEMGSRRTNERAAVAAARASYIAGFDATSNLAAGMLYDIPTAGTAAHAFVLAHESERGAFEAQVATQGPATTLLVDTFDTEAGTELAVDVAGPDLGAIRIDSGVIADAAMRSRKLLDQRGATNVKITLTGDLDEFAIADLLARAIPVDTFGVGTKLVSGYSPPGFVFKLVAIESGSAMRSVAKRSLGKLSTGGAKTAYRLFDEGVAVTELMMPERSDAPTPAGSRRLTHELVRGGVPVVETSVHSARARATSAVIELRAEAFTLAEGVPALASEVMPEIES
jgi:nicotinate phosphoribosyltransferase